jgi:hypothetical protein
LGLILLLISGFRSWFWELAFHHNKKLNFLLPELKYDALFNLETANRCVPSLVLQNQLGHWYRIIVLSTRLCVSIYLNNLEPNLEPLKDIRCRVM